jgi:hypothetical protein
MLHARKVLALGLFCVVGGASCKRAYAIGDHVLVDWEPNSPPYPARIIEATSAAKFKVHFDGYDDIWDETVGRDKIRSYVVGAVASPEPPAKVRAKAIQAARTNVYKIGAHIRVEWHGQMYPATITGIVGQERYRVSFDGYGPEWDDIVGLSRIQPNGK